MSARFAVGDRVQVRAAETTGHVRTPAYIKGKTGTVVAALGAFRNPEQLAYGGDGEPRVPLYRVGFSQRHVWPDYQGAASDSVVTEIFEHWLERA
jgi:hypothetical protein